MVTTGSGTHLRTVMCLSCACLYGDDFEPGNPLGPHKAIYKIGCIYYQFESLPSAVLSSTLNMFLALCYHTDDVKLFSWSAVYEPLVKELLALESIGIDLEINGQCI